MFFRSPDSEIGVALADASDVTSCTGNVASGIQRARFASVELFPKIRAVIVRKHESLLWIGTRGIVITRRWNNLTRPQSEVREEKIAPDRNVIIN